MKNIRSVMIYIAFEDEFLDMRLRAILEALARGEEIKYLPSAHKEADLVFVDSYKAGEKFYRSDKTLIIYSVMALTDEEFKKLGKTKNAFWLPTTAPIEKIKKKVNDVSKEFKKQTFILSEEIENMFNRKTLLDTFPEEEREIREPNESLEQYPILEEA